MMQLIMNAFCNEHLNRRSHLINDTFNAPCYAGCGYADSLVKISFFSRNFGATSAGKSETLKIVLLSTISDSLSLIGWH